MRKASSENLNTFVTKKLLLPRMSEPTLPTQQQSDRPSSPPYGANAYNYTVKTHSNEDSSYAHLNSK